MILFKTFLFALLKAAGIVAALILFFSPAQVTATEENLSPNEQTATSTETEVPAPAGAEQRRILEQQLQDLENKIKEHQKTIESYQQQGKTLKNEISTLNAKIEKINLQIKAVNLTLAKLNEEINDTQREINRTENKIDNHKKAISKAIRVIYESDRLGLVSIFFGSNRFSEFFGNLNNITLVQNNLRIALAEITSLRQKLLEQKEELSSQKEDAENLKAIQQSQKKRAEETQTQKNQLLKITKGKEAEYQKILKETQITAAQIRSRIFELLGGGELTFEKAYDYARLAERATGVRAALILAVLHRESLLGKNTGRCAYNQIMRGGTTAMHPKDIPIFLDILKKLNINPDSTVAKVSCPNADGIYGGAMGPAQFLPSTWKLYEADISKITGNSPANPWNNADAFVGAALYLQKFGATAKTPSAESKAAAIYYCGTSWQRYSCSYYAKRVVETANNFQKDIDILNASA